MRAVRAERQDVLQEDFVVGDVWPQLGLLAAATLFNLATYWAQLMASLPGLTLGQAAVNNQTTTSIATPCPAAVS